MVTSTVSQEQRDLARCERIIGKGLSTFCEVGDALIQIRDHKLYRANYQTFEEYCQHRWHFTRRRADQLIASAVAVAEMRNTVSQMPEMSERAVEELLPLNKDQREAVINKAIENGGHVTAAKMRELVDEIRTYLPADQQRNVIAETEKAIHDQAEQDARNDRQSLAEAALTFGRKMRKKLLKAGKRFERFAARAASLVKDLEVELESE